jgi:hypothetical protein
MVFLQLEVKEDLSKYELLYDRRSVRKMRCDWLSIIHKASTLRLFMYKVTA